MGLQGRYSPSAAGSRVRRTLAPPDNLRLRSSILSDGGRRWDAVIARVRIQRTLRASDRLDGPAALPKCPRLHGPVASASTAFPRFESYRRHHPSALILRSALFLARVSKDGREPVPIGRFTPVFAGYAAILRDAVLRRTPQDEIGGCCVSRSVRLVSWNRSTREHAARPRYGSLNSSANMSGL
jgi:hypothetical protein